MTLAYWCILIASLLPLFCSFIAKAQGGFQPSDNRNPREFLARTQGLSARANAAQQNGFEVFAPFAAAVLVAHATGNAAQSTINLLAVSFIAFYRLPHRLYFQLSERQTEPAFGNVDGRICLHHRAVCSRCLTAGSSENERKRIPLKRAQRISLKHFFRRPETRFPDI